MVKYRETGPDRRNQLQGSAGDDGGGQKEMNSSGQVAQGFAGDMSAREYLIPRFQVALKGRAYIMDCDIAGEYPKTSRSNDKPALCANPEHQISMDIEPCVPFEGKRAR